MLFIKIKKTKEHNKNEQQLDRDMLPIQNERG